MLLRVRLFRTPDGPADNREFRLDAIRMGRAPSADFVIPDDSAQTVSWQHARIDATPDGAILHDLKSTNGTFLNGRRVEGSERLRVGDQIRFGQTGPMLEIALIEAIAPQIPSPHEQQTYIPPPRPASPPPIQPSRPQRTPASQSAHPAQMSATRALLVGMQRKQKNWLLYGGGGLAVVLIAIIGVLIWHNVRLDSVEDEIAAINKKFLDEETDLDSLDAQQGGVTRGTKEAYDRVASLDDKVKGGRAKGETIYQRTVLSTAWVVTDGRDGTGTIVEHQGKRLIVTAYHNIHNVRKVAVILPKFLNDRVLANHGHYLLEGTSNPNESIPCSVWASDPDSDIAVLEPQGLPEYVRPLSISKSSVSSGADVHTIGGNSGASSLWSYSCGRVRGVSGPSEMVYRTGQKVRATLVETQNPINHGDSGGPLVNNKCELVGVTAGAADGLNLVARFVDIGHVRTVLDSRPQKGLSPPPPPAPPPAKFEAPPTRPKAPSPKLPAAPVRPQAAPASNGVVHVLMLIDDTDTKGIAQSVRVDELTMDRLLANGLPPGRTRIRKLRGRELTAAAVRDYYASLRPNPEDAVMCYYSGHGCWDLHSESHYFVMRQAGKLLVKRSELLRTMQEAGGRLTVLISDCCSNLIEVSRVPNAQTAEFGRGSYLTPLLLRHRGVVDIQAASRGECAIGNSAVGGYFTQQLCGVCESGLFSDWNNVYTETRRRTFEVTRRATANAAAAKKGMKPHTPFRFPTMNAVKD